MAKMKTVSVFLLLILSQMAMGVKKRAKSSGKYISIQQQAGHFWCFKKLYQFCIVLVEASHRQPMFLSLRFFFAVYQRNNSA